MENRLLNESLSDYDLMSLLEEQGFEVTYNNLCILKEGLKNGKIALEEEKNEKDEKPIEGSEEYAEEMVETSEPRISISMPVDGSMQIDNGGKQIVTDSEGNVNVSLLEKNTFLYAKNTERFLKSYFIEDCNMDIKEYELLMEDTKIDSVKSIAIDLLRIIEEKVVSIDTTPADRSRGDIKQLKELPMIQNAITQLETIIERDENVNKEYTESISIIIKSILYLNQYSSTFKDAYRNKKTIMILKYQSIILSIISSLAYLISTIIDYRGGNVKVKKNEQDISAFAPLNSLRDFVNSVDSGEFKTLTKDINILREHYLEVPVEVMATVLESYEHVDMIVGGIKNIYSQLVDGELGNKINDILYKAIGIIVILFSLRDTLYTLFRMKSRISDMNSLINNFVNINNGSGILNKISQFVNKFKADADFGSELSKREIESENKKILNTVHQIQSTNRIESDKENVTPEELVSNDSFDVNSFGFDF